MRRAAAAGRADWDEAARLTADQRAAYEADLARFNELAADPTYLTLRQTTGHTADRLRLVHEAMHAAGSLLATWDDTLTGIERRLAAPRHGGLAEVENLLHGDALKLKSGDLPRQLRPPPWSESTAPRFSLARIREFLESDLRTVAGLVAEVAERRAAADHLAAALRAVDDAGDAEGEGEGEPPRRAVADLRERALCDPLAVGLDDVGALEVELARLRCGRLAVAIDALAAEENYARARLAGHGDGTPLPQAAVGLHRRLGELEARCVAARRADLEALARLAADITAAAQAAHRAGTDAEREPRRTTAQPTRPPADAADAREAHRAGAGAEPERQRDPAAGSARARTRAEREPRPTAQPVPPAAVSADVGEARRAGAHAGAAAGQETQRPTRPAAARPGGVRVCARTDCAGGRLDEDGICETCFRAAPRHRREAP